AVVGVVEVAVVALLAGLHEPVAAARDLALRRALVGIDVVAVVALLAVVDGPVAARSGGAVAGLGHALLEAVPVGLARLGARRAARAAAEDVLAGIAGHEPAARALALAAGADERSGEDGRERRSKEKTHAFSSSSGGR